ncbi:hypothetical protein TNCV_1239891 [Trichonephila clavipes]|nr:hypothetical protein TNCV_1239891 [Trichonephila clavipes]
MTKRHYKFKETSSSARGHETAPLRAKCDIQDVSSELDYGVKRCTSWIKHPELFCSGRANSLIKPVKDLLPP